MKYYVASMTAILRGKITEYPRLYAYPSAPEFIGNKFVVLDSGAFSLSMKGKEIDDEHIRKLGLHYIKHNASDSGNVLAIAPDVFLSPEKSMANFVKIQKLYPALRTIPVLQSKRKKKIDLYGTMQQLKFYKTYNIKSICISNPSLLACEALEQGIEDVVSECRSTLGKDIWIHILGAGWNAHDVRMWGTLDINSIDSIAYYSDAVAQKTWRHLSADVFNLNADTVELALNNLKIANQIINY